MIIVTGGSSGIGLAVAGKYHSLGGHVAVIDVQPPPKDTPFDFWHCDVSDGKKVAQTVRNRLSEVGRLDILINCAGIQTYGTVLETSEEMWDKTFSVNVKGTFLMCKHTLPYLMEAGEPVIVNISSAQAFVTQKRVAAYAASKESIHGLTRSIAIDYAPKLRCVAVAPGAVNTPMLQDDLAGYSDPASVLKETEDIHLINRIAKPGEVADFIVFITSSHAALATGHVYRLDGGLGLEIGGT